MNLSEQAAVLDFGGKRGWELKDFVRDNLGFPLWLELRAMSYEV